MSKNVLFETHKTHDFLAKIRNSLLRKMLYSASAKHLMTKPQPVVYAFDYISNEIAIDGIYEIDDLNTLFEWLTRNDSQLFDGECIDAGANIGNHSLYFSRFFSRVFSFEPNPRTFKILSINADSVKNIQCFDFGLSKSTYLAKLHCINSNMGGSRVVDPEDSIESGYSVPIKVTTLDSCIEFFRNVKLIKYDVEGLEHDAILGSKKVIETFNPIVLFEQHREDFINGENKVIDLMKSFGYKKFAVIKKSSSLFKIPFIGFVVRIFRGNSRIVVLENEFKPDFYPFIIAIPDLPK